MMTDEIIFFFFFFTKHTRTKSKMSVVSSSHTANLSPFSKRSLDSNGSLLKMLFRPLSETQQLE